MQPPGSLRRRCCAARGRPDPRASPARGNARRRPAVRDRTRGSSREEPPQRALYDVDAPFGFVRAVALDEQWFSRRPRVHRREERGNGERTGHDRVGPRLRDRRKDPRVGVDVGRVRAPPPDRRPGQHAVAEGQPSGNSHAKPREPACAQNRTVRGQSAASSVNTATAYGVTMSVTTVTLGAARRSTSTVRGLTRPSRS